MRGDLEEENTGEEGRIDQWPISPKINRRLRLFFFVLKTDGGIEKFTWKNYRRPKK